MKKLMLLFVLAVAVGAQAQVTDRREVYTDWDGNPIVSEDVQHSVVGYWRHVRTVYPTGHEDGPDQCTNIKRYDAWGACTIYVKGQMDNNGSFRQISDSIVCEDNRNFPISFIDDDTMTLSWLYDNDGHMAVETWKRMKPADKADNSELFDTNDVDINPTTVNGLHIESDKLELTFGYWNKPQSRLQAQVTYVVEKTGRLSNIRILAISDKSMQNDLMDALKAMVYNPAIKDGEFVRYWDRKNIDDSVRPKKTTQQ